MNAAMLAVLAALFESAGLPNADQIGKDSVTFSDGFGNAVRIDHVNGVNFCHVSTWPTAHDSVRPFLESKGRTALSVISAMHQ